MQFIVLLAHIETQLISGDFATFVGVGAGMGLFCLLTCLVLRIFARARFGPGEHRGHYGNAHLAPPITLSSDLRKNPLLTAPKLMNSCFLVGKDLLCYYEFMSNGCVYAR